MGGEEEVVTTGNFPSARIGKVNEEECEEKCNVRSVECSAALLGRTVQIAPLHQFVYLAVQTHDPVEHSAVQNNPRGRVGWR